MKKGKKILTAEKLDKLHDSGADMSMVMDKSSSCRPGIEYHPAIELGKFIKQIRIANRITLREFSETVGLKPSELSELENGLDDHMSLKIKMKVDDLIKQITPSFIWQEAFDDFDNLVKKNQKSSILNISDIMTKEQLLPAFPNPRADPKKIMEFVEKIFSKKCNKKKRTRIF